MSQQKRRMSAEEYQRVMFGEIDGVYPQDCGPRHKSIPRFIPSPDKWDDIIWLYSLEMKNDKDERTGVNND